MAAPNAPGFFVQAGVSMVEAWYIGRLGTVSLAAIAFVFPSLMLMLSGPAFGGAQVRKGLPLSNVCIAAGMMLYRVITAASLYLGTWRPRGW